MAMSREERRKFYKAEMEKRVEESYRTKDDSGRFKSIYEPGKMSGISLWKPSEDDHSINILPYIAGNNNPRFKKGSGAYCLDIFVHNKVGVNEDSYVCMNRSFGKPCPICSHQATIGDEDEAYAKSLNPTRRVIYNIEVLDNSKERAKGVQLWNVSHFLFEKELAELALKKQGGGFVYFSDPDKEVGKIISFRRKGERQATKFPALSFEDREEPISEELLDGVYCIEELIHFPTYEEVENAFFGGEKPASKKKQDKEEDVTEYEKAKEDDVPPELEEEQEEPVKAKKGELECPCGQEFGKEYNEFENCDNCKIKDDCKEKYEELRAARPRRKAEPVDPEPTPAAPVRRRR